MNFNHQTFVLINVIATVWIIFNKINVVLNQPDLAAPTRCKSSSSSTGGGAPCGSGMLETRLSMSQSRPSEMVTASDGSSPMTRILPVTMIAIVNGTAKQCSHNQGDHFSDHMKFPDLSVGARKDLIINILFNAMVNRRCFTLIKNRPGSQGFKYCNWLLKTTIVSTRNISQLQAHKLAIAATSAFQCIQTPRWKQIKLIYLHRFQLPWLFPFSLTTLEFPGFSRFSRSPW